MRELSLVDLTNITGAKCIVTDVVDHPSEVAEKTFRAYRTINTAKEDEVKRVMELTGGMGADVAVECAGGRVSARYLIGVCDFYFWGNDPEFKIVTDELSD